MNVVQPLMHEHIPNDRGGKILVWTLFWGAILTLLTFGQFGRRTAINLWLVWLFALLLYQALTNPQRAVMLFAFVLPFEFLFFAWGEGRYNMMTYPAVAFAGLWMLARHDIRKKLSAQEQFYAAMLVWSSISMFWSVRALNGVEAIFTSLGGLAVMFLYGHVLKTGRDVLNTLWYLIAGVLGLSLALLPFYHRIGFSYDALNGEFKWNSFGSADEVSSYEVASACIVACIGSLALFEFESTSRRRLLAIILAFVLACLALLGLSRMDAIGLALTGILWFVFPPKETSNRIKRAGAVLSTFAFVVGAAILLNPQAMMMRWSSTEEFAEASDMSALTSGRTEIWSVANTLAIQHPWLGIGTGQFPIAYQEITGELRATHSAVIQSFVENGVVGLVLFLMFAMTWLVAAWKARGWRHITLAWWSYFMLTSVAHGFGRNKVVWVAAGLTIGISHWAQTQAKAKKQVQVRNVRPLQHVLEAQH